jgi:hypothetical protein
MNRSDEHDGNDSELGRWKEDASVQGSTRGTIDIDPSKKFFCSDRDYFRGDLMRVNEVLIC